MKRLLLTVGLVVGLTGCSEPPNGTPYTMYAKWAGSAHVEAVMDIYGVQDNGFLCKTLAIEMRAKQRFDQGALEVWCEEKEMVVTTGSQ